MINPTSDLRCASRAAIEHMESQEDTIEELQAEVKRLRGFVEVVEKERDYLETNADQYYTLEILSALDKLESGDY